MLIGACQGLSKVSELERVTVVAEPQITENSGTVSQENSLENEPPKKMGKRRTRLIILKMMRTFHQ